MLLCRDCEINGTKWTTWSTSIQLHEASTQRQAQQGHLQRPSFKGTREWPVACQVTLDTHYSVPALGIPGRSPSRCVSKSQAAATAAEHAAKLKENARIYLSGTCHVTSSRIRTKQCSGKQSQLQHLFELTTKSKSKTTTDTVLSQPEMSDTADVVQRSNRQRWCNATTVTPAAPHLKSDHKASSDTKLQKSRKRTKPDGLVIIIILCDSRCQLHETSNFGPLSHVSQKSMNLNASTYFLVITSLYLLIVTSLFNHQHSSNL